MGSDLPSEFSGSERSETDGTSWILRTAQSSGSSFINIGALLSKCYTKKCDKDKIECGFWRKLLHS